MYFMIFNIMINVLSFLFADNYIFIFTLLFCFV